MQALNKWRRERDSNPRKDCSFTGLANLRFRPLSHLSKPLQIRHEKTCYASPGKLQGRIRDNRPQGRIGGKTLAFPFVPQPFRQTRLHFVNRSCRRHTPTQIATSSRECREICPEAAMKIRPPLGWSCWNGISGSTKALTPPLTNPFIIHQPGLLLILQGIF